MKWWTVILITIYCNFSSAQNNESSPDFSWGNGYYFNLNAGETISFNGREIELVYLENHFNRIRVENDTIWLKVSRRSLPALINGIRIFVADNKNVKALATEKKVHGLLQKDALVCVSDFREPLLDFNRFIFPVSYNDGFLWSTEEDSYMFSYLGPDKSKAENFYQSHEGIDFNLHDARGLEKHWLLAVGKSKVVWVEEGRTGQNEKEASVLLQSSLQAEIFYLYEHLNKRNIVVREGQELVRGEPIGTVWGDETWGHLQFAVIFADSVPAYSNRHHNLVNGFPQLYELYFQESSAYTKTFTKGRIYFGRKRSLNGNQKNIAAYESYSGKGWLLGRWNPADKVDWVMKNEQGNARLKKVLFGGSPAECKNPENFFEYEINVRNGGYRIRAEIGDLFLPSWQKVSFEGVNAGEFSLAAGESTWTTERIVQVTDGKLTVRIYIDEKNKKVAGLSQIVFQRAY